MKLLILILSISCFALNIKAQEPILQWPPKTRIQTGFKLISKKQPPSFGVVPPNQVPYDKFELFVPKNKTPKPEAIVQIKTVELARKAFQKWEQHDCGIKIKGNYMKVTYQTFYSDGSSVVWDREYRS